MSRKFVNTRSTKALRDYFALPERPPTSATLHSPHAKHTKHPTKNKTKNKKENFQEKHYNCREIAWTYREALSCGVMYFENGVSPTSLAKLLCFDLANEPLKKFHYPTRYYSTTRILSSLPYPTLPQIEKPLPFRACS